MSDRVATPKIDADDGHSTVRVHPAVARGAAYAWRLLAIGLAVAAAIWLIGQLLLVVVPVAVATLLTRALWPVSSSLRRAGLRPALASVVALVGFLVAIATAVGLVGVAVAGELDELGPTLREGVDDVADWLVTDGPFDITQADIDRWRSQAGEALSSFVGSDSESVISGATLAGEVIIGSLLAWIVTFFFLKDGTRMTNAMLGWLSPQRRSVAAPAGARAWDALGGYLRGAALLGAVEATAIGLTLLFVGSGLVAPVMVVTFLAAFVPIVGAIAAGIVAVLVALVTAGTVPALIVAAVAVVVQQLDNDLLAPVIYGRAVRLHPLVVLLGIAAGGSLFGFVGTFFAVPVLAVSLNAFDEVRRRRAGSRDDDTAVIVSVE